MGIPSFYGHWLVKYAKQIILDALPDQVASLSFDLNGILHEARVLVYGDEKTDPQIMAEIASLEPAYLEGEFHRTIGRLILEVIESVKPEEVLILAVDGVAPGAKLQQQRARRARGLDTEEATGSSRIVNETEVFDKNALTPGTEVMIKLDQFLIKFIATHRPNLPPKIIYSSHLVPGEGEHKIMEYFRRGEVSEPIEGSGTGVTAGNHVIYGMDADLIMLSLLSPVEEIYLYRKNIDEIISINIFRQYLVARARRDSAVDDFVVMTFLLGNDFLPHHPTLLEIADSVNLLWTTYLQVGVSLTLEGEIDWSNMRIFIDVLAEKEDTLLATNAGRKYTYPSKFLQESVKNRKFYPTTFRSLWYHNALTPKNPSGLTERLQSIIREQRPDSSIENILTVKMGQVEEMTLDYLRTLAWNYLYYREGHQAINQDWLYPYYHAPLLADLNVMIREVIESDRPLIGYDSSASQLPFTALHQLVAVMPRKSQELLPIELRPLMAYDSPIVDLFPEKFVIEMNGINEAYKGVPLIPFIDRGRIWRAVEQIPFTLERAKLWLPGEDRKWELSPEELEFYHHQLELKKMKREFYERKKPKEYQSRGGGSSGQTRERGGRGGFRGRGRGREPFQPRTKSSPRGRTLTPSRPRESLTPPVNQPPITKFNLEAEEFIPSSLRKKTEPPTVISRPPTILSRPEGKRGGPSLVPIGMTKPEGLKVGKIYST
jgi:5'-3' exoribonuclease 1